MSEKTVHIGHRQINCVMTVDGQKDHDGKLFKVDAILDTGAMSVCINNEICVQMGLRKLGTTRVGGANGSAEVPVYVGEVGIDGLKGFKQYVEIIGLSTQTALLGYSLFKYLDTIEINNVTNEVTFHYGDSHATH